VNLVIDHLSKTYPNGVRALRDVSLTVTPGMFGLLDPNGAGKSTLMRICANLQRPDAGTVHFGDLDVLARPAEVRRALFAFAVGRRRVTPAGRLGAGLSAPGSNAVRGEGR